MLARDIPKIGGRVYNRLLAGIFAAGTVSVALNSANPPAACFIGFASAIFQYIVENVSPVIRATRSVVPALFITIARCPTAVPVGILPVTRPTITPSM